MQKQSENSFTVAADCHWTIAAFASVPPDPHQPERYDERSRFTHILDALRYFAVNAPPLGGGHRPRCRVYSTGRGR